MDVDRLSGLTLYLTVFAIVFLECGVPFGFWLPGDAMLFAVGLLAASPVHHVSLPVIAAGVTVSAVVGVLLGYLTGWMLGRPWLERRHRGILERTEAFYARFGPVTLITAVWVPWARTFAPILAGAVRMPWLRFLIAAIVGSAVWGIGIPSLGYAAATVPGLKAATGWLAPAVVGVSVLAGLVGEVIRRLARRRAPATGSDESATPSAAERLAAVEGNGP
jgi:membrane-associated protein